MLKANYHTHTYLCGHASGDINDFVLEAEKLGIEELGFSDHVKLPEFFYDEKTDDPMNITEFNEIYAPHIADAKKCSRIKIYLGLETEYYPEFHDESIRLREMVEYLVLGVHSFYYKNNFISVYNVFNAELVKAYTDTAVMGMETGLYTIFAHPDIFMLNYYSESGNRIFDNVCFECSKRLIETAIKNDVYLEINASGTNKGIVKIGENDEYVYPRSEFWKLVSKTNAKICLGVDAHRPESLGDLSVLKAEEFARKLHLNIVQFVKMKT